MRSMNMNADQQKGYDFTEGVIRRIAYLWIFGWLILSAFSLLRNSGGWGLDDSDKDGFNRSGLRVHTDHKTGIQYLSDGNGGLIRREAVSK